MRDHDFTYKVKVYVDQLSPTTVYFKHQDLNFYLQYYNGKPTGLTDKLPKSTFREYTDDAGEFRKFMYRLLMKASKLSIELDYDDIQSIDIINAVLDGNVLEYQALRRQ